jgi:DUF1009 family protein
MPDPARPGLGILAGGGSLPGRVAAAATAAGRPVFIVALEGFAEPQTVAAYPHATARIGAAGRILELLRANHCRDVVLVGAVRRPGFFDMRPDAVGAALLARVGKGVFFGGDDGLLRAVVRVLGEEGFSVIGAHDILAEALAPAGLLTTAAPDALAMTDIARGATIARALGSLDIGQGCVIQAGLVLAVEAIEGTDAMLARAGTLRREGPGGVLVKTVKPGQDRRTDLPTIGPNTIRAAHTAGLRGIAFEAGGTLLADRHTTITTANSLNLFLLGFDPTAVGG